MEIKSKNKEVFIVSILGINDRNQSEELKGTELYITRDSLPELDEENFYINDLLGMSVQNSSGEILGVVENFYNFGAGDIIEIKCDGDKKLKCYSFTKKLFPIIDMKNNKITISEN